MSNKDLSGKPHKIVSNGDMWWYEDGRGIEVYCMRENKPTAIGTITWRAIRNALKRKDKKE